MTSREVETVFYKSGIGVLALLFTLGAGSARAIGGDGSCTDRTISASAVRTTSDVQAFVECAAAYLADHGEFLAHRAFHGEERWQHGSIYVFVVGIADSGFDQQVYVYPPDRSREGDVWGTPIRDFGTDLAAETQRVMDLTGAGWLYYTVANPTTGETVPKASYMVEVEWEGERAVIGSGIYPRAAPGSCSEEEVNAAALAATPSVELLQDFVRCAAMLLESGGETAIDLLERSPRWSSSPSYVFAMDLMGNQVISGNWPRINAVAFHEWGSPAGYKDLFGGLEVLDVADALGETYVYYRSLNPSNGRVETKVGFLKRTVAHGVPLVVGSGYYPGPDDSAVGSPCEDSSVAASAIHTRSDIEAFVRCAAEYFEEHGEEETRRAFNEDARWKSGPIYIFVDGLAGSAAESVVHVFPPDPSRQGMVWGDPLFSFGQDYFTEVHRVLSLVDSGWTYYATTDPSTGLTSPKSSFVIRAEWNGNPVAIGAGIYERDLPGTCTAHDVSAWMLTSEGGDRRLRELVNCAALVYQSLGPFSHRQLSRSARWLHGPTYLFGIDGNDGTIVFSGSRASFRFSGRIPELFAGRDLVQVARTFGEAFGYYSFQNPVTGMSETKVSLFKTVWHQGRPTVVGSGYHPR